MMAIIRRLNYQHLLYFWSVVRTGSLTRACEELALSAPMRAWINAFDPDNIAGRAPLPDGNANNVMWAADIWHSIKKLWCLEARRLLRAPRPPPAR